MTSCKIHKIYGPPGTGKTTRLLELVKQYDIKKVGYFAFTRKAANEAKGRINLPDKKLKYFQTLHAFAFHTLGLSEDSVMQPYHYEDLGKILGIRVNYVDRFNDQQIHYLTSDNIYFQTINKMQNQDIEEYEDRDIDPGLLRHIVVNLAEYKKKNNLLDFNDMIKRFVNKPELCPNFDAVFIDEAQDLSPLQWMMYDILKTKTNNIYLAGDDDQAIFQWAGADVTRFIEEPGTEQILTQSRRIPKSIQELSKVITERIQGIKIYKKYLPRDIEGKIEYVNNVGQLDLKKGKWLILARTNTRLKDVMKKLQEMGLYYQYKKGKSFKAKLYKTIVNYTRWTKGEPLEDNEIKDILECCDSKPDKTKPWYEVFTAVPMVERDYLRHMLSNGEKLTEDARIKLSTIHAAKGGEEDSVVLILDNSQKIRDAIMHDHVKSDEEHRVWYVGATRAKNNLYLMRAKKERYGYQL